MGKFTITHEINCNAETFWKTFLDKNFHERLYLEALGYPEFKIVEQRETDREVIRKCIAQPKAQWPGPIAKVLGSGFRLTDEGSLDKATLVWQFKYIPSVHPDKIHYEGTLRIEPIGDNKVRRIAETEVEAKIFGIGGLIESSWEKQTREEWNNSAVFMNKWIAAGKAI